MYCMCNIYIYTWTAAQAAISARAVLLQIFARVWEICPSLKNSPECCFDQIYEQHSLEQINHVYRENMIEPNKVFHK